MSRSTHLLHMLPVQAATYADMCRTVMKSKQPLFGDPLGPILLTRLSMYATSTVRATTTGAMVLGNPSVKLRAFGRLLEDHSRQDEPTVVFVSSIQFLNILSKKVKKVRAGNRVTIVSPESPAKVRLRALRAFTGGDKPILLTMPQSIAIGDDLSRARRAVFLQRSWARGVDDWALRTLPPDAEVVDYVTAGTIDVHQHLDVDRLASIVTTEKTTKDFLFGRLLTPPGGG